MCFWLLWSAPSSSLANRRDSGTIDKICSTVAQLRKGPNTPKYSDGVFNLFTSALYWQVQRTQKGMIDFALLWQNRINPPGPRWETLPKVTSFFVCVCVCVCASPLCFSICPHRVWQMAASELDEALRLPCQAQSYYKSTLHGQPKRKIPFQSTTPNLRQGWKMFIRWGKESDKAHHFYCCCCYCYYLY